MPRPIRRSHTPRGPTMSRLLAAVRLWIPCEWLLQGDVGLRSGPAAGRLTHRAPSDIGLFPRAADLIPPRPGHGARRHGTAPDRLQVPAVPTRRRPPDRLSG